MSHVRFSVARLLGGETGPHLSGPCATARSPETAWRSIAHIVPISVAYQPEYNMMTGKTPFFARISYGLSTTLLVLSLTSGVSAVGAESEDAGFSWRETLVIPIMSALHEVQDRLAGLEATVALFPISFGSQQITTNELCVADDTGAQTCITKAQLDAVLKTMAQVAATEPPAKVTESAVTEGKAAAALEPAAAEPAAERVTEATGPAAEEPVVEPTTIVAAPVTEGSVTVTVAQAMPAQAALNGRELGA